MSTDEVVDTSGAPVLQGRRQAWLRIGVPVGGLALVIIAILAIALYSYLANRAGVVLLSDDLLSSLQGRITQQVTSYLDPAVRTARLVRDVVARNPISARSGELELFASGALRQVPQIDAFYSGDSEGNFIMVQRGEASGTVTKIVRNSPAPRAVEWIKHDADGRASERKEDPGDQYDPRTRNWYQGALKTNDVFWTSVYVFFTRREPGITAAIRYSEAGGVDRVFGVDIKLEALSEFLASLKIGRRGRAAIIDDADQLIAAPNAPAMLRELGGQKVTARLDQLDDPILASAYDRFRVEGYGRRVIEVDGARMISVASRLPITGRDWSLLMVVPETDFIGFVASNERNTLWLSLFVVMVAAALAALLARQGLRADRTARMLLDRGDAIERQCVAFAQLARQVDFFDRSREAPLQALTTALGDLAAARRTSVWRLSGCGRLLHCDDAYERDCSGHVAGIRLSRAELPQFFKAMDSGVEIQTSDAAKDRRTADFHRVLMHPIASRGVHVVPVRWADKSVGVIVLEDAANYSGAREFAALFANVLAIRMLDEADVQPTSRTEAIASTPVTAGERNFDSELLLSGRDLTAISADLIPSAAVMSIKFCDTAAIAARDPSGTTNLADCIAATLQDIAATYDIPYVKLVGSTVVAAAGLTPNDVTALTRIADASVAARERCLELLESGGHPPSFRIGVSCGVAVGGNVGRQPRLFNLWGDAVDTAELMADTGASPGTIQVCEAAYYRLRAEFLFRPRGTFYLPAVGSTRTFVLGSRQ
jgi:class 3 adenylate cyclase